MVGARIWLLDNQRCPVVVSRSPQTPLPPSPPPDGDHPGDDIAGAKAAGLRAIWFNPQGKDWQGEAAPDAQIRRLAELPALLAGWSAVR